MGSNTSKPSGDAAVLKQKNDLDIDANSDPRSPTPEITRTPLQGKTGSKHNITKNADLRKTFENSKGDEKLIRNNPILSAVIKNHLQSYDPRSPTQDFERTPIIIATKIDELTNDKQVQRLENGGSPCLRKDDNEDNYDSCAEAQESPDLMVPKNLCNGFYDLTLNESIKETDEPLGSSTASNEALEDNMTNQSAEKPIQLLETNFDYVEAEVDQFEDSNETDHGACDKESVEDSDLKCIPQFKILDEDPRSPSAGIERTPIVVAKVTEDAGADNVEEMSDDTLIKVLQNTNADLRQLVVKSTNEGVLIYEDEANDLLNTPKKPKNGSCSGSRTPLSCMKNKTDTGHTRSKSANMLEDSKDQQLAKARRVSHIPRLKSLTKQTKLMPTGSTVSLKSLSKKAAISGDCENTPPHSQRDKWDKDNSIVL
ncbi:uncharacterized protein LOC126374596 [Pectinophora gossypiella]|nr:uncharacterized protein LOC126374596 [Pectinophora gossypiella]